MYLRTRTPCENSNQPAHSRSLIRIFTGRWTAEDTKVDHADKEDSDQTAAESQADLRLR